MGPPGAGRYDPQGRGRCGVAADLFHFSRPARHALAVLVVAPLAWRRRRPVAVMLVVGFQLLVLWFADPALSFGIGTQLAFLVAVYTPAAWARNRQLLLAATFGMLAVFLASTAYAFAFTGFVDAAIGADAGPADGLFSPATALLLFWMLKDTVTVATVFALGQLAWSRAKAAALAEEQAETISGQAAALRDQALLAERLRIARDLHDVVAGHVSVMGVQAAGARKTLRRNPELAEQALENVEVSARGAVDQMRSLVGTLRGADDPSTNDRLAGPGAGDLRQLAREAAGVRVTYHAIEDAPDAIASLPPGVGLILYRTAAEAIANVHRHSTATTASLTLRVGRDGQGKRYAEVEVLDSGRPKAGTSGTGLGLLGIRERLTSVGGVCEVGPRVTGGYRVRVRIPVAAAGAVHAQSTAQDGAR
ncbi:MAG: sensor histidine kinase [Micrococcales bacterium]|nr:MAG: sensor histidine kinase [Micrococcales bacterium]